MKREYEARELAQILGSMVEGPAGDPERIYAPDYEPADGDVYVARAAELLLEFASAAPTEGVPVPLKLVQLLGLVKKDGVLKRSSELQEAFRLLDSAIGDKAC